MPSRSWLLVIAFVTATPVSHGLEPKNVFILVNKNMDESRAVAEHYCQRRGVPKVNLIALDLPKGEDISRQEYDTKMVAPIRHALKDRKEQAKVLLSVYGIPLRVGGTTPNKGDQAELAKIKKQMDELKVLEQALRKELTELQAKHKSKPSKELADQIQEKRTRQQTLSSQSRSLSMRQRWHAHHESQACVDSELSLLWWDKYELRRWIPNLLNFQVPDKSRKEKPPILMVSRLDGPSVALVKRLVDQSIAVEKNGLAGKVYVDARGIQFDPKQDSGHGYGGYDESLREMARLLEKEAKLTVILDNKPALFAPNSCPECALYCGWYSLARYVPCCKFVPGAVAFHIASSEAVSLRDPKSTLWCKNLLEAGAVATLGPVAEPYTIGFPKPAEFFGLLVTGKYTLVECYYRTLLLNSWMTVLVGDPLYNPYAKTPKLTEDKVKPSPAKGRFLFRLGKRVSKWHQGSKSSTANSNK